MKRKMQQRVIAVVMTLLMTISLLPADFLGGEVIEVQAAEVTYTLTPSDIPDSSKTVNGDTYITDGTFKTAFQLTGAKWRWYSDRLDGGKSNNCALVYTVQTSGATGKLEVTMCAAGSGKTSIITLVDGLGNPVPMTNGNTSITLTDTTQTTLVWDNLDQANGPYTLSSATDKMRIFSVTATETVSSGPVAPPTATTISVTADPSNLANLTISGTGTAGDADSKYIIIRTDAQGDEKKLTAAGNSTSFSVEDTLEETGTYTYKVYGLGKTNTGTEDTTAEVTASPYSYVLPLAKATPVAAADNEFVKLTWSAVKEATSYDVKVYEGATELTAKSKTGITGTTVTIDGLTNGTEYTFVVVAHRADPAATTESDEVKATPVAPLAGITWLKADLLNDWSSSSSPYVVDSMWSLLPGGSSMAVEATTPLTTSDGLTFSKRISTKGSGSASPKRVVQLTLTQDSYVVIYAASSGSSRPLVIAKSDGTIVTQLSLAAKNTVVDPSRAIDLEAGTYYFYSTGGTGYIYGIKVGEGSAPRAAWSTVPNPTINSVTDNGDGTITVDYDALLGTDGADGGRVFMYQNGFEVANVDADSTGVATFTPSTDGDFTFKVIISRENEADKESNVYTLTGYEMPLESPVITWVDNLGDGSVYVDWNNITADSFDVLYKESSAGTYSTAVEGITAGNYTITGLTPGKEYEIKVVAHNSVKGDSADTETITVGEPVQQWYADVFGSATASTITINGTDYALAAQSDNYPAGNAVADITNTDGKITIAASTNGKVADSEEGITIYYTRINPNTENFKLTATFKVVDDSSVNNQSAYGIFATDIPGVGSKDAKYFNSVSVGQFKMFGGFYHANGARLITGYTSYNPTSTAGTGRNLNNTNLFSYQKGDDTSVNGDTYTYTLEKTNTGYVASMTGAGETITFDGVQNLMVQEDGSIIVGVANARVGVEITDIKFEKTAGTIEGGVTAEQIEPAVKVYSSNVTGSVDYEFIASTNVDGWLDVYDSAGKRVFEGSVKADEVVKVPMTLANPGGYNGLRYAFAPSKSVPNLTSYGEVSSTINVIHQQWGEEGETIYVSPNGNSGAAGTESDPLDLQTALNHAQAGQTIVMLDGTYYPEKDYVIPRSVNGTEEKPITLMAQNPGKVVIDGSKMETSSSLLSVVGSFWHVYGLEVTNGIAKGISICGNNNTIEMCTVHNVGNSGFQISRYAGEPNDNGMWPENNLIKNCEAYDCCDPGRSDADGFAAKLTCGEGNTFYGCISHHNIDDGWDLYAKSTTGPIGAVTIENCIAYSNGFLSTDDPSDPNVAFGEGNGFKLGGENMFGAHQLINSIAYNNYNKGITSNSGPNCEVHNCTTFNNSLSGKSYNVSMYTKSDNPKAWVLDGVLSVVESGGQASPVKELGASNGVLYSLRSATNYFYDGSSSTNTEGVTATAAWFVSTDVTIKPTRNADGTIDMHGLLELLGTAPSNTGARLVTTGEAVSVQPGVTRTVSTKMVMSFFGPAPSPVKSVNTGDKTPIVPLAVIMLSSAGVCVSFLFKKRKRA